MINKTPGGVPTAHIDTFACDNMPPVESLPICDYSNTPELSNYPNYLNVATEILDNAINKGFGDKRAVALGDVAWTYSELLDKSNRIAEVLTEDCGLVSGNRVLLRAPNTPMLVAAWFGVIKAGGICVTTMPLLKARELQAPIERAKVSIALCDQDLAEEMKIAVDSSSTIKHLLYFSRVGSLDSESTLELACKGKTGKFDNVNTAADDIAIIAFTSGTTGQPKGAMHFHRDIMATTDTCGLSITKVTPSDIITGTPPLAFTFGLGGLMIFPLTFGASIQFLESPYPEHILSTIEKYKVTQIYTAPTAYRAMLDLVQDYDISSLWQGVSAGETLPKSTWESFYEATGIRLIDGLGSTEMFHIFISKPPEEMRPGYTGSALPGYRACIFDDKGNEVGPGVPGFLAVQGPTGCKYIDDPERQKNYVKNGWNYPGDIYEMSIDGYLKYVARADDMIVSSGYNISGPEVEAILLEHELVSECAVIASPDPDRGNIVKAFIVLRGKAQSNNELVTELQKFVKTSIAPYKYPRAIEFVKELPKTQTGKLQRYRLRQLEVKDRS